MKWHQGSVQNFFRVMVIGASLTAVLLIICLALLTGNVTLVLYGLLMTTALFAWGAVFLIFFQKKLSEFTGSLCKTLDGMINGNEEPEMDFNAETSLARISHRLKKLYDIMQINRIKVEEEKAELQSLVSDISHQTKTPIANLKMVNDTLLTRPMSEEKKREFLMATGSQLDK
ncbi:MAG: sensor histidine kinase, partial [Eubacterium sp.]